MRSGRSFTMGWLWLLVHETRQTKQRTLRYMICPFDKPMVSNTVRCASKTPAFGCDPTEHEEMLRALKTVSWTPQASHTCEGRFASNPGS
jgi:hypothetical protein